MPIKTRPSSKKQDQIARRKAADAILTLAFDVYAHAALEGTACLKAALREHLKAALREQVNKFSPSRDERTLLIKEMDRQLRTRGDEYAHEAFTLAEQEGVPC
jgi:hypothetical protein